MAVILHGTTKGISEGTVLNLYLKHQGDEQLPVVHPVVHDNAWSETIGAGDLHSGIYDTTIEWPTGNLPETKHHFVVEAAAAVLAYETTGPSSHLFGVVDLTTGVFTPRGDMGQAMEGIGTLGGVLYGASHAGDTLY